MSDQEPLGEERDPVRKILKNVPKVKANSDFELRLQRRIAEGAEERSPKGLIGAIMRPRRIPLIAYSLTTLLLVGVASYYAFFRSGMVPKETRELLQQNDKEVSPPAPAGAESAGGKREDRINETEKKVEATPAPRIEAPAEGNLRQLQTTENVQRGASLKADDSRRSAENELGKAGLDAKKESHGGEESAAAPSVVQEIAAPPEAQSKTAPERDEAQPAEQGRLKTAPMVQQEYRLTSPESSMGIAKDAPFKQQLRQTQIGQYNYSARRDSLQADSIRRWQKKQQLLQQQQKTKTIRPDGGR